MPGPLYHVNAVTMCPHGGQAKVISANMRVLVSGMPVATAADMAVIAGCPFNVSSVPKPCVTIKWLVPATRVLVNGQPALLQTSTALCLAADQSPQGPPNIITNQMRVIGT